LRLKEVEQLLEGERITADLVREASDLAVRCVQPIDDVRTTAAYRRRLIGVYVKRAIEELSR
jgi:carbon-monoxide dehydrogenase medium subunit